METVDLGNIMLTNNGKVNKKLEFLIVKAVVPELLRYYYRSNVYIKLFVAKKKKNYYFFRHFLECTS